MNEQKQEIKCPAWFLKHDIHIPINPCWQYVPVLVSPKKRQYVPEGKMGATMV